MPAITFGLNSPFPWAPGHAYIELEHMCYKKLSSGDGNQYVFPWIENPISRALVDKFSALLSPHGISIVTDPNAILQFLVSDTNKVDISLSSIKYARRKDVSAEHYRRHESPDAYTNLCDHVGYKLFPLVSSNQALNTDQLDYIIGYNRFSAFFDNIKLELIKRVDSSNVFINNIRSQDKKIALINIREHKANGSSGLTPDQFQPLVSYLNDSGYLIVDVSHDEKSLYVNSFCEENNIYKYWQSEYKSPAADIDLFAMASCYIGAGGISHLALMLRVPTLWVGNLYPIPIAASIGFQVPCRLTSKRTNHTLTADESFFQYFTRPELWDNKYDSWLKKYGKFNMHNCYDELAHAFHIIRPEGITILNSFIDMENIMLREQKFDNQSESRLKDLLGRKLLYLSPSPSWHV